MSNVPAILANNAAKAALADARASMTPEGLIAAAKAAEAEGAASNVKQVAALAAALVMFRFPAVGDGMDVKKAAEAVRLTYGMESKAWQHSIRKKHCGLAQRLATDYAGENDAAAAVVRNAADSTDAVRIVTGWMCNATGINNPAAVTVEAVRNVYFPPRGGSLSDEAKAERKMDTLLATIAGLDRSDLFDVVRAAVARKRTLDNPAAAAAAAAADIGAKLRAKAEAKQAEAAVKSAKVNDAAVAARMARRAKAAEAAGALEAAAKAAEAAAKAAGAAANG